MSALDEGHVPLDDALRLFKEGIGLTKELSKTLDDIERKVEILAKKDDGTIEKKPFPEEEP